MLPPTVVLTLGNITQKIRETFATFIDPRKGKNKQYSITDAALSAFSVFFTQSPSFLEYQRTLEQTHSKNNASSLFGVHEIPVVPYDDLSTRLPLKNLLEIQADFCRLGHLKAPPKFHVTIKFVHYLMPHHQQLLNQQLITFLIR